jgi:hypothetical protein
MAERGPRSDVPFRRCLPTLYATLRLSSLRWAKASPVSMADVEGATGVYGLFTDSARVWDRPGTGGSACRTGRTRSLLRCAQARIAMKIRRVEPHAARCGRRSARRSSWVLHLVRQPAEQCRARPVEGERGDTAARRSGRSDRPKPFRAEPVHSPVEGYWVAASGQVESFTGPVPARLTGKITTEGDCLRFRLDRPGMDSRSEATAVQAGSYRPRRDGHAFPAAGASGAPTPDQQDSEVQPKDYEILEHQRSS